MAAEEEKDSSMNESTVRIIVISDSDATTSALFSQLKTQKPERIKLKNDVVVHKTVVNAKQLATLDEEISLAPGVVSAEFIEIDVKSIENHCDSIISDLDVYIDCVWFVTDPSDEARLESSLAAFNKISKHSSMRYKFISVILHPNDDAQTSGDENADKKSRWEKLVQLFRQISAHQGIIQVVVMAKNALIKLLKKWLKDASKRARPSVSLQDRPQYVAPNDPEAKNCKYQMQYILEPCFEVPSFAFYVATGNEVFLTLRHAYLLIIDNVAAKKVLNGEINNDQCVLKCELLIEDRIDFYDIKGLVSQLKNSGKVKIGDIKIVVDWMKWSDFMKDMGRKEGLKDLKSYGCFNVDWEGQSLKQMKEEIEKDASEWNGLEYDAFSKNCQHYTNHLWEMYVNQKVELPNKEAFAHGKAFLGKFVQK